MSARVNVTPTRKSYRLLWSWNLWRDIRAFQSTMFAPKTSAPAAGGLSINVGSANNSLL